jgi:nitronate monooxygenase
MADQLTERLDIAYPIIQAPMAGVSTPKMVAAVSNAGALGSLGLGASTTEAAREAIRSTKALSGKPFNVNFFCHQPAIRDDAKEAAWLDRLTPEFERFGASPPQGLTEIYTSFIVNDEMFEMVLEERPAVVSLHFGLPRGDWLAAMQSAGILLFATATSINEARRLEAAGIDAIVAQGYDAGGHRGIFDPDAPDGRLSTLALTRLLVRETALPIIAAGGIMDGAGIRAMLDLGAEATQLGTAFVACDESAADEGYRKALAGPNAHLTEMTRAVSGRPARIVSNRLSAFGNTLPEDAVPAYPFTYDASKALHAAAKTKGEHDFGAHWAGQGAPMIRPMGAAELVATLAREAGFVSC